MAGVSRLGFDAASHDFLINGRPLLQQLAKHERVDPSMYQASLCVQPLAKDRLLGEGDPDLSEGHVAIYVCGMCGDYDGSPIGACLELDETDIVRWTDLGWHDDVDGWHSFSKVRSFRFNKSEYFKVISRVL